MDLRRGRQTDGMKRLLLLSFLCLMPAAANAESVWLLLSRQEAGMEKIEMRDMQQCKEMRDYWWEESGKRRGSYSVCLRGK